MKRSEMVKVIQDYFDFHNFDIKGTGISSEVLLKKIEEAGMLPPAIKTSHGFLGDEYGMVNEWEDE